MIKNENIEVMHKLHVILLRLNFKTTLHCECHHQGSAVSKQNKYFTIAILLPISKPNRTLYVIVRNEIACVYVLVLSIQIYIG